MVGKEGGGHCGNCFLFRVQSDVAVSAVMCDSVAENGIRVLACAQPGNVSQSVEQVNTSPLWLSGTPMVGIEVGGIGNQQF